MCLSSLKPNPELIERSDRPPAFLIFGPDSAWSALARVESLFFLFSPIHKRPSPGSLIKFFQRAEARGNLGVNNGIDSQQVALSMEGQLFFRPPSPVWILGEDIQKDAAVD